MNSKTHEQRLAALTDLIADKESKNLKYCPDCGEELGRDGNDGKTIFCPNCPLLHTDKTKRRKKLTPPDLSRCLWYLVENGAEEKTTGIYCKFYCHDTMWGVRELPAGSVLIERWDFSKSLLRDQHESVITFLYDLLITK